MFRGLFYTGALPTPLLRNCCVEIGAGRCGDDACRDVAQAIRRGFSLFADITRTAAGDVAERAAESAEASPASVKCDLADRHLSVAKQGLGFFDAAGEQVSVGWKSESFLELAREVRGGDVADLGEALHGPLLVGGGVHAVLGAQQAAEEVGVLGVGWLHFTADKRCMANA